MNDHSSGIFITINRFMSLPVAVQKAILSIFEQSGQAISPDTEAQTEDEQFAELSPGQARTFLAGCSAKTRKAIETMVAGPTRYFQVADVAQALGVAPSELRGVWGGLTRRTQTVTGDPGAYLVDWTKSDGIYDADDNYLDQRGEVSALTYHSFRKAFGLS